MPKVQLTDRFCATVKPLAIQTDFFDKIVPGLALRVTKAGHRSWSFLFTSPRDGKRARATIGTYPATTLAAARGKALEARGHVEAGNDPRLVLSGQAAAEMNVTDLVEPYLAALKSRGLRSSSEIERRLRKNVVPVIGQVRLDSLRRRDARNVIEPIMRRGSLTEANRVFEDLRGMVRWGVQVEYLDVDPLQSMPRPAENKISDRVLTDDEIRTLWNGLPTSLARSVQCQRIIKLCLTTAQRCGEVAGMVSAEIDFRSREWRLPAARTKNGHPHLVPLSDLAIEIINDAMKEAGNGKPLFTVSTQIVSTAIFRANAITETRPLGRFGIASWSVHDLRRTALTGMARLGVAPIVLGHVANHRTTTKAGVTLAVYSQYGYGEEKRTALDLWASRLAAITDGDAAKVVSLGRSANVPR
jgi:integrase